MKVLSCIYSFTELIFVHYLRQHYLLLINRRAYGNILNVGEELKKETMPLQNGSRIYQLQGLRPKTCYEVKISYPASVEFKRGESELLPEHPRKLLNTEKLIFKNDDADLQNDPV
uniref:Uncharacterized protein n=1 Tax=Helianthus annuus TaxID=4232 RepID=A0A251SH23_HELAN